MARTKKETEDETPVVEDTPVDAPEESVAEEADVEKTEEVNAGVEDVLAKALEQGYIGVKAGKEGSQ